MNWLAHVFLSGADIELRLGNLLADIVRGDELRRMSEGFQRGAELHRRIDSFTDSHPLVKRSRTRLGSEHRRFSGVLVDVFYDHLLASRWDDYSPTALDDFTAEFYAQTQPHLAGLPDPARATLERIIRHDLLGSYRHIEGVERSLRRLSAYLSSRWRREFALERAVPTLLADRQGFDADFVAFFPELQAAASTSLADSVRR